MFFGGTRNQTYLIFSRKKVIFFCQKYKSLSRAITTPHCFFYIFAINELHLKNQKSL